MPEEDGRKCGLPRIFVTRSHFGHGSVALPWAILHARTVALPWAILHAPARWGSREASPTPRTPGRPGHGHGLPGPWTGRPRPFRLRAPASDGPVPFAAASPSQPPPELAEATG
jgi:hypothetical protein